MYPGVYGFPDPFGASLHPDREERVESIMVRIEKDIGEKRRIVHQRARRTPMYRGAKQLNAVDVLLCGFL